MSCGYEIPLIKCKKEIYKSVRKVWNIIKHTDICTVGAPKEVRKVPKYFTHKCPSFD